MVTIGDDDQNELEARATVENSLGNRLDIKEKKGTLKQSWSLGAL